MTGPFFVLRIENRVGKFHDVNADKEWEAENRRNRRGIGCGIRLLSTMINRRLNPGLVHTAVFDVELDVVSVLFFRAKIFRGEKKSCEHTLRHGFRTDFRVNPA